MDNEQRIDYSPKDSARFGLNIYRGTFAKPEEKKIFEAIVSNEVDVAILRAPVATSQKLQRMRRFGFEPIHADTLVYYGVDLEKYEPKPLRNELTFSEAEAADKPRLDELVGSVFAAYTSHYHANPLFRHKDILDGYREWALDHLSGNAKRRIWVARKEGQIIAFACCRYDSDARTCEGVLYGVHPDHAGGGVYGDLIRYTQARFKKAAFASMKVSTQIGNFAVQKVWTREGFYLEEAYDTFHFNTLLARKIGVAKNSTICFTAAEVEAFGKLSGDMNPVHFDDAAARQAGFDARICHGLLPAAELSRIFGTEYPGMGSLFLGLRMAFLRPLYQEIEHTLHIRFVPVSPNGDFQLAAAVIRDPDARVCVLAYSDLRHRPAT